MSTRLIDRLFFRSLFRAFGFLSREGAAQPLVPYFQYKIGPFQPDYYLYFRREPDWRRYRYEIFDKLYALAGYDIPLYLDFHYSKYPDEGKADFRRFMRYEMITPLLSQKKGMNTYEAKLHVVEEWLEEKEKVETAKTAVLGAGQVNDNWKEQVEEIVGETNRSHFGNIIITGWHHQKKLIGLFLLVKNLRSPGKMGEPLFSAFSTTDMAAILRQFEPWRPLKVNTLQKKIAECNETLQEDEKARVLEEALVRFFFE